MIKMHSSGSFLHGGGGVGRVVCGKRGAQGDVNKEGRQEFQQ